MNLGRIPETAYDDPVFLKCVCQRATEGQAHPAANVFTNGVSGGISLTSANVTLIAGLYIITGGMNIYNAARGRHD